MRIHSAPSVGSDWPAPRDAESTLGGSQFEFGADIFGPNKPSSSAKATPRPYAATLPEGSQYDFGADVFGSDPNHVERSERSVADDASEACVTGKLPRQCMLS